MGKQAVRQMIIVDWDARQYATIDTVAGDEDWTGKVNAEKDKGRDIHCFSHDFADASGLMNWAKQHKLISTDARAILPSP
jgi:hypothetical protein